MALLNCNSINQYSLVYIYRMPHAKYFGIVYVAFIVRGGVGHDQSDDMY